MLYKAVVAGGWDVRAYVTCIRVVASAVISSGPGDMATITCMDRGCKCGHHELSG